MSLRGTKLCTKTRPDGSRELYQKNKKITTLWDKVRFWKTLIQWRNYESLRKSKKPD